MKQRISGNVEHECQFEKKYSVPQLEQEGFRKEPVIIKKLRSGRV